MEGLHTYGRGEGLQATVSNMFFFFPNKNVYGFLSPVPKIPTTNPSFTFYYVLSFFSHHLKMIRANQLFIILVGDSYIYIIGYKVFSELLVSSQPQYVNSICPKENLLLLEQKLFLFSGFIIFISPRKYCELC